MRDQQNGGKSKVPYVLLDKKGDFGESGIYVTFTDDKGVKAYAAVNHAAIDKDMELAGYNLLVNSELKISDRDIYSAYNNLWRLEESFRIMKSDLDARPVFVQKESTLKEHFLICYLTVLLERIFQFNVLDNKFCASEIFDFFRDFKAVKADGKYIKTTTVSSFISELA